MSDRHFGLIGYPLSHSISREIFQDIFLREAVQGSTYRLFPMKDISGFKPLVIQEPTLRGLNVTIPFKKVIIPYLDRIDEEARKIGAINCIRIVRSGGIPVLEGFNTDKPAFVETLKPLLKPHHRKALILGSGGAAGAVAAGLKELDIEFTLVSRHPGQDEISYADLKERGLADFQLIINTTPLGMFPETSGLPDITYHQLTPGHLLYDLVYNPETTAFLQKGIDAGATVRNGLPMLRRQAELSWEIWR